MEVRQQQATATRTSDHATLPDTESQVPPLVLLECVKEGSKLRVRIISPGYKHSANCQFPRNIRAPGKRYSVVSAGVQLVKGPKGRFFYRIDKKLVVVVNEGDQDTQPVTGVKVFGDDEDPTCVICMDAPKTLVFVPCGHYACCKECVTTIKNRGSGYCPLCRSAFTSAVDRELVE